MCSSLRHTRAHTSPPFYLQGKAMGGTEQMVFAKIAHLFYEFCHTPHVCQEQRRRGFPAVARYPTLFQYTSCYQHVDAKSACDTRHMYVHALCMQVKIWQPGSNCLRQGTLL